MKVSIQVLGSLGDVMPYISLARALQDQGADVSLFAPRDYTDLIHAMSVQTAPPAGFSLRDWMHEAGERGTLDNPVTLVRDWSVMIRPHLEDIMAHTLDAARGADLVVANAVCTPARVAAEAAGAAFILSAQQPVISPTREVPCAMVWQPWQGERFNRQGYSMIGLAHRLIGVTLNRFRRELALPRKPCFADLSSHLGGPLPKVTTLPWPVLTERPAGWDADDILLAYPSLPPADEAALSLPLRDFLAAGPPPVHVGLGSLGESYGGGLLDIAIEALAGLGLRGIVSKALTTPDTRLPDFIHVAGHEPHDRLFPLCAGIIHHGGAGTVDTSLRAGVPQILQPHVLDQFWYADRLARLGVAPPALPRKGLTADLLQDALRLALSAPMVRRAREVQSQALSRDGAREFADLILSLAAGDARARVRPAPRPERRIARR